MPKAAGAFGGWHKVHRYLALRTAFQIAQQGTRCELKRETLLTERVSFPHFQILFGHGRKRLGVNPHLSTGRRKPADQPMVHGRENQLHPRIVQGNLFPRTGRDGELLVDHAGGGLRAERKLFFSVQVLHGSVAIHNIEKGLNARFQPGIGGMIVELQRQRGLAT